MKTRTSLFTIMLTNIFSITFGQTKEIQLTKYQQTVPKGKVWFITNQKPYTASLSDGTNTSGTQCNAAFHSNPSYIFGITYTEQGQVKPKTLGFTFSKVSTLDNKIYQINPYFFIEDNMDGNDIQKSLSSKFQPKEIAFYSGTSIWLTSCITNLMIQERDIKPGEMIARKNQVQPSKTNTLLKENNQIEEEQLPNVLVEANSFSEDIAAVAAMIKGLKQYGYINKNGEFIITPKYIRAETFKEGFGLCVLDHNQGVEFINKQGKNEFNTAFTDARGFEQGFAAIKLGRKWGFINKKGQLLISKLKYDAVDDFNDGIAAVGIDGEGWGYIDTLGNEIIIPQFSYAGKFCEGLAAVSADRNSTFMYINKTGNIIIKLAPQDWPHITFPKYAPLLDPHPLADNETWVDKANKDLGNFKDGLAIITITRASYQFSGLAAIDKKGDIILKFKNTNTLYCKNNDLWIASEANSKFGFINSKGKWIIYPSFDKVGIFSDGLARVKLNGNCGFIDSSGKIVINQDILKGSSEIKTSSIFSYASDFCEGLAVVKTRGKYGFIDKSGNWIIKPNLEGALTFKDGVAPVKFSSRAGWNYIDKQGKILFEKLQ